MTVTWFIFIQCICNVMQSAISHLVSDKSIYICAASHFIIYILASRQMWYCININFFSSSRYLQCTRMELEIHC